MTSTVITRPDIEISSVDPVVYLTNVEKLICGGGEYNAATQGCVPNKDFVVSAAAWFARGLKGIQLAERVGLEKPGRVQPPERDEAQEKLYLGLGLLMSLGKEISDQNSASINKRWQAIVTTSSFEDKITDSYQAFTVAAVKVLQTTLTPRPGIRKALVEQVLASEYSGLDAAVISQVTMVWENYGYKAVLFMESFINTGSIVLEIEAILDQAITLKRHLSTAREKDGNFAYSRVLNPHAHPELNHKSYNHLYIASIMYAKQVKAVGENFKMSASITSAYTAQISRYLKADARLGVGDPSQDVIRKLQTLGLQARKRRHDEDSDSEDERNDRRRRRH